jgi:rod shape-determining protein MreD
MRLLRAAGVFLGGLFVQWFWATYFVPFGMAPQILLLLTAAVAARSGTLAGLFYGFFWGLCLDTFGTHVFGAHALELTLTAYGVGVLRRQMDVSSLASQMTLMTVLTVPYSLTYGLLGLVFERQFLWVGWLNFLVGPIYNGLVAPMAFAVVRRYMEA